MSGLLAFIIVSAGIIIVPGPNVLVIISTSLSHGKVRGLQTVAGTSVAMAIQLIVAAVGTAWFVAALTKGFLWLKWLGVLYLIYLGIRHLVEASRQSQAPITAVGSFQRGFWVSLTNPKTILFFGAFLPQFTVFTQPYLAQIALLSIVFWLLAVALDSSYALLANRFRKLLISKTISKYQNGVTGVLYLGAGTALSVAESG